MGEIYISVEPTALTMQASTLRACRANISDEVDTAAGLPNVLGFYAPYAQPSPQFIAALSDCERQWAAGLRAMAQRTGELETAMVRAAQGYIDADLLPGAR